jgi:hypothetical protein
VANAGTAFGSMRNITRAFILNSFLLNQGSTSNYRLASSAKINWIRAFMPASGPVWNGSTSIIVGSSVSLCWQSEYSSDVTLTETNVGSTTQSCIFRPPKDSVAGFWSVGGVGESDVIFSLYASAGTLLDISFSYQLASLVDYVATSVTTTASGTNGSIYQSYLDGPSSGAVFIPLGIQPLN